MWLELPFVLTSWRVGVSMAAKLSSSCLFNLGLSGRDTEVEVGREAWILVEVDREDVLVEEEDVECTLVEEDMEFALTWVVDMEFALTWVGVESPLVPSDGMEVKVRELDGREWSRAANFSSTTCLFNSAVCFSSASLAFSASWRMARALNPGSSRKE